MATLSGVQGRGRSAIIQIPILVRNQKPSDKEKLRDMGENYDRKKRITIESETRKRELSFSIKTIMIRCLP